MLSTDVLFLAQCLVRVVLNVCYKPAENGKEILEWVDVFYKFV